MKNNYLCMFQVFLVITFFLILYVYVNIDINIITIGSFIGFILFNTVLILKHKK